MKESEGDRNNYKGDNQLSQLLWSHVTAVTCGVRRFIVHLL